MSDSSSVEIRLAKRGDEEEIADLLDLLDRYYGDVPEMRQNRLRDIDSSLFSDTPAAWAILAWSGQKLAGMACYSFLWPAVGSTRSLYLKELYVDVSKQRQGVGRRLVDEIIRAARANGCSRVEWTTDADNESARLFYEALGVASRQPKIFYRIADL